MSNLSYESILECDVIVLVSLNCTVKFFCEKLKEFNLHIYKLITYGKYKNEGKK